MLFIISDSLYLGFAALHVDQPGDGDGVFHMEQGDAFHVNFVLNIYFWPVLPGFFSSIHYAELRFSKAEL